MNNKILYIGISSILLTAPLASDKIEFPDKSLYDGSVKLHDGRKVRQGNGKMTYKNGDVYNGAWKNDMRHGKGKMTYKRGDIVEGYWKEGKFVSATDAKCSWWYGQAGVCDNNQSRQGFIPGFMYIIADSRNEYIKDAYVDAGGYVRRGKSLKHFASLYPSITYYRHFSKKTPAGEWKGLSDMFWGISLAFNSGINKEESGNSLALAFTLGYRFNVSD